MRFDAAATTQITHRCFGGAAGTFRALGEAIGTTTDLPLSPTRGGGVIGRRRRLARIRRAADDAPATVRRPPSVRPAHPRPAPDLNPVFFGEASREFAANWTGAGLDESVVDTEALRRNWLSDRPDPRTACLLQYAWLTEQVAIGSRPPTAGELVLTQSNQRGSR